MTDKTENTREAWLEEAAAYINEALLAPNNVSAPRLIKLACSFPPHCRGTDQLAKTLPREHSSAGINEIYINPKLEDKRQILHVLVKQLLLARHDASAKNAKADALLIGITGSLNDEQPTLTKELEKELHAMAKELDRYPHKRVDVSKHKKDGKRQVLVICRDKKCDVLVDLKKNAKWRSSMEMISYFATCPVCGSHNIETDPTIGSYK